MSYSPPDMADRVALVTGSSRGAGAAIAAVLGQSGATVYVTGRSTRGSSTTEDLPGTIEDAADEVTARGGRGIPVRVDHTVDSDVEALFARVREDHGRLDVLVNNAWGGYESYSDFDAPFWEQPMARRFDAMFVAGVRPALIASGLAAPLLRADRSKHPGLIVNTVAWLGDDYPGNLPYFVAKSAMVAMAKGMAHELRDENVAALAVAPGWMRTERIMRAHELGGLDLSRTESPEYVARGIAALAGDPGVMASSGTVTYAGELSRAYGFTDVDGSQPEVFTIAG